MVVATTLWSELLAISFTVFSANLHPTEAPSIKRQKLTDSSGNLYEAMSVICSSPLANNVPDNKAAGILILSKIKIKNKDAAISITKFKWFWAK